ncbi:hypothetical protein [Psychroserpens sp.]|uniref:hypothetical protein n=1 Tax=Psychroserpens sp. TaxID=2020870 RepID=UPI002B278DF3|nr:hypothetical protein [Psychroserpens sp.]
MKLGNQILGPADFSFDYFINNGFIGCSCSKCAEKLIITIQLHNSGKPVDQIIDEFDETILNQLIEHKIVNLNRDGKQGDLGFSKYILWHLDALYSIITCKSCSFNFLAIFGIGEIQPGRDQVQFKGIWELKD